MNTIHSPSDYPADYHTWSRERQNEYYKERHGEDGFGSFGSTAQGHNEKNSSSKGGFGSFGSTAQGHNEKNSTPEWEEP